MKQVTNSEISFVQSDKAVKEVKEEKNQEGRVFGYALNHKRAKAKLLKGAKRDKNLNVEVKSGCVNLRFDDGSYFGIILPLLREWQQEEVKLLISIKLM